MPIEFKFILFQILIITPFIAGSLVKKRIGDLERSSKRIVSINLMFVEPLIGFWTIWGLSLSFDLVYLPVSGFALVLLGFLFGRFGARALGLFGKRRITFHISTSLANHGFTMGGFICYLFLGEQGLGLALIFLIYFIPFIYLFIFPYSRLKSTGDGLTFGSLRDLVINTRNMPIYGGMLALVLQLAGISRPEIFFPVDLLIMISVVLYYFILGTNFNLSDLKANRREQAVLTLVKFIILPAVTWSVLNLFDLDRGVETVIFIQSFMPAAVYSVVTSVLFDLDSRLASGLFVVNTIIFILLVLPVLFILRGIPASPLLP